MIVDAFKCFGNDLGMRCELAYVTDGRTEPNTAQVNINICCKKKDKKICSYCIIQSLNHNELFIYDFGFQKHRHLKYKTDAKLCPSSQAAVRIALPYPWLLKHINYH